MTNIETYIDMICTQESQINILVLATMSYIYCSLTC